MNDPIAIKNAQRKKPEHHVAEIDFSEGRVVCACGQRLRLPEIPTDSLIREQEVADMFADHRR